MSNKLLQSVTKTRDKLSSKEKLLFKAVTAVIQTLHGKIIDYLSENYPKQTMPQWVDNFSYIDLLFKDNKYFILIFIEKCQFPEKAFEINESFFEDSFIVKEFNKAITMYENNKKSEISKKLFEIMKQPNLTMVEQEKMFNELMAELSKITNNQVGV